jgi:hypothetical protein
MSKASQEELAPLLAAASSRQDDSDSESTEYVDHRKLVTKHESALRELYERFARLINSSSIPLHVVIDSTRKLKNFAQWLLDLVEDDDDEDDESEEDGSFHASDEDDDEDDDDEDDEECASCGELECKCD